MKKMNRKGFTIVELVIVIAVIAILAGVLSPTFSGIVTKANESKALQEVKNAYTVYLADALTDESADTPATKIYVEYNNVKITIIDGAAKIVETDPGETTRLYVVNKGTEKTLNTSNADIS